MLKYIVLCVFVELIFARNIEIPRTLSENKNTYHVRKKFQNGSLELTKNTTKASVDHILNKNKTVNTSKNSLFDLKREIRKGNIKKNILMDSRLKTKELRTSIEKDMYRKKHISGPTNKLLADYKKEMKKKPEIRRERKRAEERRRRAAKAHRK